MHWRRRIGLRASIHRTRTAEHLNYRKRPIKTTASSADAKLARGRCQRPPEPDEKTLKPEPGEVVSKNDYELNQAIAFLKTRGTTSTAKVN